MKKYRSNNYQKINPTYVFFTSSNILLTGYTFYLSNRINEMSQALEQLTKQIEKKDNDLWAVTQALTEIKAKKSFSTLDFISKIFMFVENHPNIILAVSCTCAGVFVYKGIVGLPVFLFKKSIAKGFIYAGSFLPAGWLVEKKCFDFKDADWTFYVNTIDGKISQISAGYREGLQANVAQLLNDALTSTANQAAAASAETLLNNRQAVTEALDFMSKIAPY
jgi:hypothetical protein